jgi:hypothetical protein
MGNIEKKQYFCALSFYLIKPMENPLQNNNPSKNTSPWAWIPSLYLAQGLPYVAVMVISVIMYKRMGVSNSAIAYYTSWLNVVQFGNARQQMQQCSSYQGLLRKTRIIS